MKSQIPQLILASASPRRRELIRYTGIPCGFAKPEIDETPLRYESARAMVRRLAKEKGLSIARAKIWKKPVVILSSDTTVLAPGGKIILGKPRSHVEAERMLVRLSGKTHVVFTAYALIEVLEGKIHRMKCRSVSTRVKIRKVDREWIKAYIKSGEPMDKAGAYAAQGIGMGLVESISGSYTNVVGLPVSQLLEDLAVFGLRSKPQKKLAH